MEIRGLSYLDAIRPEPGWTTDLSLMTSYSSDMVVLVAVMLALAGLDDESGSGNKIDFANAHEKLHDRLRFIVQAGRITSPKVKPAILGIMDRFVQEVRFDEHERSWHPKLALVRYTQLEQNHVQWRFWIGSRNLTRDGSYDIGLLLVANLDPTEDGVEIAGMGDIGCVLMKMAGLSTHTPASIKRELDRAQWVVPPGVAIRRIELRHDGHITGLPDAPKELQELLVISPFLDDRTVRQLGTWGGETTQRLLLSTRTALTKLLTQARLPIVGFKLLFMDAPDDESESIKYEELGDEAEQLLRGLHAKLICAKMRDGARVWLGSANATARGWQGKNTEAIVELDINEKLYGDLREFVGKGTVLTRSEQDDVDTDPHEKLIEDVRKYVVSAWEAKLSIKSNTPVLSNKVAFNPGISGVKMKVGILTSCPVECPVGDKIIELPKITTYRITEFVVVKLSIGDLQAEWIQKVELTSGLPHDRDQRALAQYLTPRVFLEWIRSLLHSEQVPDSDGKWDEEIKESKRQGESPTVSAPWWAPSLEEVLRAWARNPDAIALVDQKIKTYMRYLDERENEEKYHNDKKVLKDFATTWKVLRRELIQQGHNG